MPPGVTRGGRGTLTSSLHQTTAPRPLTPEPATRESAPTPAQPLSPQPPGSETLRWRYSSAWHNALTDLECPAGPDCQIWGSPLWPQVGSPPRSAWPAHPLSLTGHGACPTSRPLSATTDHGAPHSDPHAAVLGPVEGAGPEEEAETATGREGRGGRWEGTRSIYKDRPSEAPAAPDPFWMDVPLTGLRPVPGGAPLRPTGGRPG